MVKRDFDPIHPGEVLLEEYLGYASSMARTCGVFVYGLHKTGTMFLYRLFRELSALLGLEFFSSNNRPKNHTELSTDIGDSFCLCPIRTYRITRESYKNIQTILHIVQVRDPRDILVSQYFSFGWFHPTNTWDGTRFKERRKIQSMSIDDYAMEAATETVYGRPSLMRRYKPILAESVASSGDLVCVRYEDMVNDFGGWLHRVTGHLRIAAHDELANGLYEKFNLEFRVPGSKNFHKRNVAPGEHRARLRSATIEELNHRFEAVLTRFGYD